MSLIKGDPAAVRALANKFAALANDLTTDTGTLDKTVAKLTAPDCWNSQASQAFVTAWQLDGKNAKEIATECDDAQSTLNTLAGSLENLQSQAASLVARAQQEGFAVDDDGNVRFVKFSQLPHGLPPSDQSDIHRGEAQEHEPARASYQSQTAQLIHEAKLARDRAKAAFQQIQVRSTVLTSPKAWKVPDRVDQAKVKNAANALKNGTDADVAAALAGLNGAELDALIASLSGDQRKRLGYLLSGNPQLPAVGGLSLEDRQKLAEYVLQNASIASLDKLGMSHPGYTDVDGYWHDTNWWDKLWGDHHGDPWNFAANGGELYTRGADDADPISPYDIKQGYLGDCYFLSSLGTVAMQNPDTIRKMIRPNPNGTYTVTFYRNGKPVEVTVTPEYPQYQGGGTVFAHSAEGYGNVQEQWPLIVEKAYAQYKGTYGDIEGGWPHKAMTEITGQPSHSQSSGSIHNASDVQHMLDSKQAVCANTKGDSKEFLTDNPKIVSGHSYMVVGTHDGKVVLRNPWGDTNQAPVQLELTMDQFHKYFDSVDSNQIK